jgi:hypothetical protein
MKNRSLFLLFSMACFVIAFILLAAILTGCGGGGGVHVTVTPTCNPAHTIIQHNQVRCILITPVAFPTLGHK